MTLGDRLYKAMIDNGFNPNKIAIKTGIHATTIKNWISGTTVPDNLKLDFVCKLLGVSSEWVKTGDGDPKGNQNHEKKQNVISDDVDAVNEPPVKLILCPECISKQKEIEYWKMKFYALCDDSHETEKKYRELLEKQIDVKKEEPFTDNQKAG